MRQLLKTQKSNENFAKRSVNKKEWHQLNALERKERIARHWDKIRTAFKAQLFLVRNKRAVNKKFLSNLAANQTDTHTRNLALMETENEEDLEACIKITTESKCAKIVDTFFALTFVYDTVVIPLILSVRQNEYFID